VLVEQVMTRKVVTIEPTASVPSATALLHAGQFRHLPVAVDGRLVGIVSDRDLAHAEERQVGEVMHSPVVTVSVATPIEVAASLLAENKIGALPVVDGSTGELVGIVSQTDLFVVLARLLRGDGPSTRLELCLTDLPRQLAVIAAAADRQQVGITSLVTIPSSGAHTVVLRIGTIDPRRFIDDLGEAGINVRLS
jgi:acetoin utilization protein AcuB